METYNLINNISLVSMGSSSVDLVVGSDFDGDPIGTILADGWPVITLYMNDPDSSGEWAWLQGPSDNLEAPWRMAALQLMVAVGEVTEEGDQRYASAVGGPDEVEVWSEVMGEAASEGHGLIDLVDRSLEQMRRRFA